ncbi:MAG: alpha/beta hydrolase [Candidatus Krumholzibacteriia bacterium]
MTLRSLIPSGLVFGLVLAAAAVVAQPPHEPEPDEIIPPDKAPTWLENRGEHELVLVHGLGASAEIWDPILPFLANSFQVHVYELHGHGHTPALPNPSIGAEADALGAWIKEQGLVYPALVGHGLGGMIAMQYAFEHPADVQRLVVIDAGPRQLATEDYKNEVADQLVHDYDRFVASHFVSISKDEKVCEQAVDWALRTDAVTFTSLLLSSFDWDLSADLPRQSVPMLVIGSAAFLPEPGNERAWLEQYGFGSARVLSFKRVDGAGHYVMMEKPAFLASVLTVFLRSEEFR